MYFKKHTIFFIVALLISISFSAEANQTKKDEKMVNIWNQYVDYWKKHDTKIKENLGDSQEDIKKVEDFFQVQLPQSLKDSLSLQYHSCRKGKNQKYPYLWFGDLMGAELLTSKMMMEEYLQNLKTLDMNKDDVKNIYIGNIKPYEKKGWPKDWVPILASLDMGVTLFLDLRKDSSKFGQVLGLFYLAETDKDGYHNRIAFISNSYEEFMQDALEYIKINRGLDNEYFLKLFDLPLSYYDSDAMLPTEMNNEEKELAEAVREMVANGGWSEETINKMSKHYPIHVIEKLKEIIPSK